MSGPPEYGERASCVRCGQELEWVGKWWDRGSDTKCGPSRNHPDDDYTREHVVIRCNEEDML
jgi:hypothetical protein